MSCVVYDNKYVVVYPDETVFVRRKRVSLDTETVKSTAIALEGVDNVERGDGLTLSVVSVVGSILNNAHKELTENIANAVVDQERDTLDTTTAGETADSRLGDTLEVITRELSVTLGAALS